MKYHYVAAQKDGKVIEEETDALGPAEVLEFLSKKGLRPISIKPVRSFAIKKELFGSPVNISDKVFLTKYLALMLRVGTDLLKAINILIDDFDKPVVKKLLIEIKSSLEKGQPFYSTFAKYPKIFSPIFINLVKAGEASGNLETVFSNLTVSLEKEQQLKSKIRAAMIYPLILMSMSLAMVVFLVTVALPRIAKMFASSGFEPPIFSKIVFDVGLFLGDYIWPLLIILGVVIIFFGFFFTRTLLGKQILSRIFSRVPIVKNLLKKIALQRFASTLSSLMKSGLPILDSIEITAETVGNEELKKSLLRISRQGISRGLTLGEAFKREASFPRVITNLMSVSERAGHTENVLFTLSEFYETEIDTSLKTLVSFLEPVMLLIIGAAIGGIALAIVIPIYQLVGRF